MAGSSQIWHAFCPQLSDETFSLVSLPDLKTKYSIEPWSSQDRTRDLHSETLAAESKGANPLSTSLSTVVQPCQGWLSSAQVAHRETEDWVTKI